MDYNDYGNYYNDMYSSGIDGGVVGVILAVFGIWLFFILAFVVFTIIYNWKIYKKAGKEGWESIVPIYNIIVKFKFLNIPMWVLILCFIPGANVAVPIITAINMAKKFGKDGGFIVGLIFLPIVFYPILAFGKSEFNENAKGIFDDDQENSDNTNTKYCTNCGSKVNGKYCSKCGKEVI